MFQQPNSPTNKVIHNPFKNFIQCLDAYQHRKNFTVQDSLQLFDTTQRQYKQHFVQYYQPLDNSCNIGLPFFQVQNPYLLWQQQHEVFQFNPSEEFKLSSQIKKKTFVSIDMSLNTISDLLHMLDSYPYADDTEYNIDLKSLHNIRPELEKFHQMIGNEQFKKSILRQLLYFMQKLDDLNVDYKHMVITGPPGTGKTEMAKIIGQMYSKLGILKKNVFKKVTRSELVAGYLGQTAIKTKKVVEECLGGVLFFDEAYSMTVDESYSKECVDTLCECLSEHREQFMMIIAGYENELENTFFKINSGMKSRFMWKFDIEPYSIEELMKIFFKFVEDNTWSYSSDIDLKWFSQKKDSFQYNGRDMELLFSYVKVSHAQRIFGKDPKHKKIITIEDMDHGFEIFQENKKIKQKENMFGLYI